MAELDEKICKQMDGLVELLTTSGKPTLNPEIMKKFKKFCRISDGYVEHAFELLMTQLAVKHAEVRLSAYQMIHELFMRSHMFRELLLASFDTFLELTAGTEKKNPMPPPKAVAENLKNSMSRSLLIWMEKFGPAYRKLVLGFEFLKSFKKIDFDSIQASLNLERQQKEETERKLEESRKEKIDKVNKEFSESELDIQMCLTEVDNGLQLLLPKPDDFFISLNDGPGISFCNTSTSAVTSLMTSSTAHNDGTRGNSKTCTKENGVQCKHKQKLNEINEDNVEESESKTENKDNSSKNSSLHNSGQISYNEPGDDDGSDADSDSDDDNEDDFIDANISADSHFTKEHGLLDHKFALTVEIGQGSSRLHETEDNEDLIQEVRDKYTLIKTKHLPAVKRWLKVLCENGAKEEKMKEITALKDKLEDAIKKCVELEIAQSKRKRKDDSDSDEDDFEDVPEKEGFEEDIPEHIKMEAVMASTSKGTKSNGKNKGKNAKSQPKSTKSAQKKLGIKNVKQMAKDILESQRLLEVDDLDSALLKSQAGKASTKARKRHDVKGFLQCDESVSKKSTCSKVSNQYSAYKTSSTKTTTSGNSEIKTLVNQSETKMTGSTTETLKPQNAVEEQVDETDRKQSLLEKAPFVNFGVDLEHWENPDKIKAPVKNRFDNASRFWVPEKEVDDQQPGTSEEVAALTRRSYTFAGEFEPVKWKCRAPLPDGRLCERMDRVKCPFHGKIIGREKDGVPSDSGNTEQLTKDEHEKGEEGSSSETEGNAVATRDKGPAKGKGKKKAKKRKYPNLTDINESNDSSRTRLEAKIFNRSTLRRVNKSLDAASMKKLANKFSNQFNYSLK